VLELKKERGEEKGREGVGGREGGREGGSVWYVGRDGGAAWISTGTGASQD
jgi:hypothetical protein